MGHARPMSTGDSPLGDLTHGVAFIIVAEIGFARDGLLAWKWTKKVFSNPLGLPKRPKAACKPHRPVSI